MGFFSLSTDYFFIHMLCWLLVLPLVDTQCKGLQLSETTRLEPWQHHIQHHTQLLNVSHSLYHTDTLVLSRMELKRDMREAHLSSYVLVCWREELFKGITFWNLNIWVRLERTYFTQIHCPDLLQKCQGQANTILQKYEAGVSLESSH